MNQKQGAMPVILLLIFCTVLSVWVWKNVPVEQEKSVDIAGLKLETLELDSLLAEGKPVLLHVSSDNCPYCVMMAPELADIYAGYGDAVLIRDINADKYPDAYLQLPVRGTPMQVFYYADGTPYVPGEAVAQQIYFLRYVTKDTGEHVMTVHEGMMTAEQMELVLQDLGVVR